MEFECEGCGCWLEDDEVFDCEYCIGLFCWHCFSLYHGENCNMKEKNKVRRIY